MVILISPLGVIYYTLLLSRVLLIRLQKGTRAGGPCAAFSIMELRVGGSKERRSIISLYVDINASSLSLVLFYLQRCCKYNAYIYLGFSETALLRKHMLAFILHSSTGQFWGSFTMSRCWFNVYSCIHVLYSFVNAQEVSTMLGGSLLYLDL